LSGASEEFWAAMAEPTRVAPINSVAAVPEQTALLTPRKLLAIHINFVAWKQPEAFSSELRDPFRSLR
jgi:hypothetical protein